MSRAYRDQIQFTTPPGVPWAARIRKPPKHVALITHDFPLRPDMLIRLTLPVELTGEDARRLRVFLLSLAMDEAS